MVNTHAVFLPIPRLIERERLVDPDGRMWHRLSPRRVSPISCRASATSPGETSSEPEGRARRGAGERRGEDRGSRGEGRGVGRFVAPRAFFLFQQGCEIKMIRDAIRRERVSRRALLNTDERTAPVSGFPWSGSVRKNVNLLDRRLTP